VEALCDFHFEPDQTWDWTIPGLVYDKVKAEFPQKRQQNLVSFEVRAEPQGVTQGVTGGNITRMQFLRSNGEALVQVGPDNLTINHLKPYPGWPTFKEMIERGLAVYRSVADPKAIRRISLRYINRIQLQEHQVQIEDYMLSLPHLPDPVPQVFASWVQRVEVPFERSNGVMAIQSGSINEPQSVGVAFMLDLDFFTLRPEVIPLDSTMNWVEKAHDEVEGTFEACITEKTKRLFDEVSDNE
jgi:uncharacterized protein (TIGR04255 family)